MHGRRLEIVQNNISRLNQNGYVEILTLQLSSQIDRHALFPPFQLTAVPSIRLTRPLTRATLLIDTGIHTPPFLLQHLHQSHQQLPDLHGRLPRRRPRITMQLKLPDPRRILALSLNPVRSHPIRQRRINRGGTINKAQAALARKRYTAPLVARGRRRLVPKQHGIFVRGRLADIRVEREQPAPRMQRRQNALDHAPRVRRILPVPGPRIPLQLDLVRVCIRPLAGNARRPVGQNRVAAC